MLPLFWICWVEGRVSSAGNTTALLSTIIPSVVAENRTGSHRVLEWYRKPFISNPSNSRCTWSSVYYLIKIIFYYTWVGFSYFNIQTILEKIGDTPEKEKNSNELQNAHLEHIKPVKSNSTYGFVFLVNAL